MATVIFGLAKTDEHASRIVRALNANGFNDISILAADRGRTTQLATENSTKAPEGAAAGATGGALLGGALGWMAGIGALAIPGVGPLIAAGPIMAALGGAALGGTAGGVTGALVGLGLPEYEAKQYEDKLNAGNILISVHCQNEKSSERATEILKTEKAESISSESVSESGTAAPKAKAVRPRV